MDLGLKGKKAVVTGGTRGIGRAVAETLAASGADVAICARNADQVVEVTAALRHKGVKAVGRALDVGDGTALKAWVAEAGETLGGIDILVSNPSAFGIGNSEDDWKKSYDVDLMGAVRVVQAAEPLLEHAARARGDAAIIVISSAAAAETDFESAYGALKAALIHFTKGAARRLAAKGVRVNAVSPGTVYFDNGFWAQMQHDMPQLYQTYMNRNPLGRMATPQEIANVVAFLCAPVASFTTGANIVVDGALTNRINF